MQNAIVTGVLGQDGSYLAELLLSEGYNVYGIGKRVSTGTNLTNAEGFLKDPNMHLVEGDIMDIPFMSGMVADLKPELFFNLAAQSHVGYSFKSPVETFRVNSESVVSQLDILRKLSPITHYYQASTSEMFGGLDCPSAGYNEESKFNPRSPYAVAKVASHMMVANYRSAYKMYACCGILFNHSSPRRGEDFATRKITKGMAEVSLGMRDHIEMGNMEARRDEGHSKDYVRAMYMMMHNDRGPTDYVVATGRQASIREMFEYVASLAGKSYDEVFRMNPEFTRPSDVPFLLGDSIKIREELNWSPEYTWENLLEEMYNNDINLNNG
jgi:GDPmannose 4,6-dehydratase